MRITLFVRVLFLLVILVSGLSFWLSYRMQSYFYLFTGIFFLLAGVFSIGILMTIQLFQQDKQIDYDIVESSGLHLVTCVECGKENVLEDQFCRYCGNQLEGELNV